MKPRIKPQQPLVKISDAEFSVLQLMRKHIGSYMRKTINFHGNEIYRMYDHVHNPIMNVPVKDVVALIKKQQLVKINSTVTLNEKI